MSTLGDAVNTHLLVGIAVALVLSIAVSAFSVFQKELYLCLLCLLAAVAYHWRAFPSFLAVNGIAYVSLCWLNRQTIGPRRWRWACGALVSLIIIFTLGRVLHLDRLALPGLYGILVFSLDMWLVLRLVTVFWEVGSGRLAAPSMSAFIIWTCLPFTLGGPLLRYSEFPLTLRTKPTLWRSAAWWMEGAAGLGTLMLGVSLPIAHNAAFVRWLHSDLLSKAALTFFTVPVSFYLTTAGYYSVMEALGKPAGFILPMSFNYPLWRENISAFWVNWNMTATAVFRDYLFYNRWGRRGYNVYFNTMALFILVGLWHAANPYWILWGFLHGLLFCGFLVWRKYGSRLGHVPLRGTPVARASARVLTYVSVCACWYLPSKILQKLGRI
jgi:D-alanyl-lipoteichoic acid acyltransferase DltB (MBOAT superfamily)